MLTKTRKGGENARQKDMFRFRVIDEDVCSFLQISSDFFGFPDPFHTTVTSLPTSARLRSAKERGSAPVPCSFVSPLVVMTRMKAKKKKKSELKSGYFLYVCVSAPRCLLFFFFFPFRSRVSMEALHLSLRGDDVRDATKEDDTDVNSSTCISHASTMTRSPVSEVFLSRRTETEEQITRTLRWKSRISKNQDTLVQTLRKKNHVEQALRRSLLDVCKKQQNTDEELDLTRRKLERREMFFDNERRDLLRRISDLESRIDGLKSSKNVLNRKEKVISGSKRIEFLKQTLAERRKTTFIHPRILNDGRIIDVPNQGNEEKLESEKTSVFGEEDRKHQDDMPSLRSSSSPESFFQSSSDRVFDSLVSNVNDDSLDEQNFDENRVGDKLSGGTFCPGFESLSERDVVNEEKITSKTIGMDEQVVFSFFSEGQSCESNTKVTADRVASSSCIIESRNRVLASAPSTVPANPRNHDSIERKPIEERVLDDNISHSPLSSEIETIHKTRSLSKECNFEQTTNETIHFTLLREENTVVEDSCFQSPPSDFSIRSSLYHPHSLQESRDSSVDSPGSILLGSCIQNSNSTFDSSLLYETLVDTSSSSFASLEDVDGPGETSISSWMDENSRQVKKDRPRTAPLVSFCSETLDSNLVPRFVCQKDFSQQRIYQDGLEFLRRIERWRTLEFNEQRSQNTVKLRSVQEQARCEPILLCQHIGLEKKRPSTAQSRRSEDSIDPFHSRVSIRGERRGTSISPDKHMWSRWVSSSSSSSPSIESAVDLMVNGVSPTRPSINPIFSSRFSNTPTDPNSRLHAQKTIMRRR